MLTPILCGKELHDSGGPGVFYSFCAEQVLSMLANEYMGKVQLIYLDPPFQTGETFRMRIGKEVVSRAAYTDILSHNRYIDMMRHVLFGCRQLLSDTGSIYLHVDYRMIAPLRLLMDEVFGAKNFRNEIIWAYKTGGRSKSYYPRKHDNILYYAKSRNTYFNIESVGIPRGPERKNHMKRSLDADGRVCYSIRSGGRLYQYYEDALVYPSDVWTDIAHLQQRDPERNGYATQKPEKLIERILLASSRPGDLVMDVFSGSGTTASVASKTGRRFLACDSSPYALYALRHRQLHTHSTPNLLQGEQQLLLHFPAEPLHADVQTVLERKNGSICCIITGYAALMNIAEKDNTLIYCALGTISDGTFTPIHYTECASYPIRLFANNCEKPVLHTVDAAGRQGFWQLYSE